MAEWPDRRLLVVKFASCRVVLVSPLIAGVLVRLRTHLLPHVARPKANLPRAARYHRGAVMSLSLAIVRDHVGGPAPRFEIAIAVAV